MAEIQRTTLFGKLNSLAYKSIESGTVFCKLRGNPYVELVHWFHQILQLEDSDFHHIIQFFQLDPSRLAADVVAALDKLPRGATSIQDFSPHLEQAVERGWVFSTLLFGEAQVRTGHLVYALIETPGLKNLFFGLSRELAKIKGEALADEFSKITAGSPEESMSASDGSGLSAGAAPGETSGSMSPAVMGKQEALARFSVDLTEKARNGEIDPIVGRDEEIRQLVDILLRRRQNNPILTGEAGGTLQGELTACQRYALVADLSTVSLVPGAGFTTSAAAFTIPFLVTMRTAPSATSSGTFTANENGVGTRTFTALGSFGARTTALSFEMSGSSGLTVGKPLAANSGVIVITAEL